jgi:predicted Fe-Mo cluster-binding NifX family protein
MNIAIASDGNKLEDQVSQSFESCKYLLIVELPDMRVNAIKNDDDSSGENLAKKIIELDCELIITGKINNVAFDILADACVTRYFGTGKTGVRAIELMENDSLRLIRNTEGSNLC